MKVEYYVTDATTGIPVWAEIRKATQFDYKKTVEEQWQTSWLSDFIQTDSLEKYALEIAATGELVGLGAYRDPTLAGRHKYKGMGAALLAYGIQLSIDYGYGGAIYLKAKTSEIREHYIRDFGAIPFSRLDPYLLLIDGEAARELFSQYLKEE